MRFDFNETNILRQNLFSNGDTKEILVRRLSNLLETTDDPLLKDSVVSLIGKIETLSEKQIKLIQLDIANNKLIATANYDYGKC